MCESRRLEDVQITTSSGRLIYDVFWVSDLRRLLDIWFTTSWRRLIYIIWKTSNLQHLENIWFTTSSGRLIYDVLKTSDLRCLGEVLLMTSWRRLIYDVLKTYVKQRLCSNVVAKSAQRQKKWFFFMLYCLKYSENFKWSSVSWYIKMEFCTN